jgi:hypothetical protein
MRPFGSIEKKRGVDQPNYVPPARPDDIDSMDATGTPAPGHIGRLNLRRILLVVAIVGGGVLVAYGKRSCSGFTNSNDAWSNSLVAALALCVWAGIVASAVVLVRRMRKTDASWRRAFLSGPTIGITCVLALGGSLGGAQTRSNNCGFTKSGRSTSGALKREQDQFIAWYTAWFACLTPNGTTLTHEEKHLEAAVKGTSAAAAHRAANSALTAYTDSASCVAKLPAENPELANADRRLVVSSQLEVHAFQIYREGVKDLIAGKGSARFASGAAPEERAHRIAKSVATNLEALYLRLGGAAALGSRLPAQAILRAKAQE